MSKRPEGSKLTYREHYEAIRKATGKIPPELDVEPLPAEYVYLWTWFTELYHPEGMTYTEIANWAKLTRKKPTPSETQTLKAMDNAFRRIINDG